MARSAAPPKPTAYSGLKRIGPDLHEAVLRKELSVNRAMQQAGKRKRTRTIPADDPVGAARSLARAFDAGQLQQLIAELARYLGTQKRPGQSDRGAFYLVYSGPAAMVQCRVSSHQSSGQTHASSNRTSAVG